MTTRGPACLPAFEEVTKACISNGPTRLMSDAALVQILNGDLKGDRKSRMELLRVYISLLEKIIKATEPSDDFLLQKLNSKLAKMERRLFIDTLEDFTKQDSDILYVVPCLENEVPRLLESCKTKEDFDKVSELFEMWKRYLTRMGETPEVGFIEGSFYLYSLKDDSITTDPVFQKLREQKFRATDSMNAEEQKTFIDAFSKTAPEWKPVQEALTKVSHSAKLFNKLTRPKGLLLADSQVGPLLRLIFINNDKTGKHAVPEELFKFDFSKLTEDTRTTLEKYLTHAVGVALNAHITVFFAGIYFRNKALCAIQAAPKPDGFPSDFTSNSVTLKSLFSAIKNGCKNAKCDSFFSLLNDFIYASELIVGKKNNLDGVPADFTFSDKKVIENLRMASYYYDLYVDTDASHAGSLANRLAAKPGTPWLEKSVSEVKNALEFVEMDPTDYRKIIKALYESRIRRKAEYHLDSTNPLSLKVKMEAALKNTGLKTIEFFKSENYDLNQQLAAFKAFVEYAAISKDPIIISHLVEDRIKSYRRLFRADVADPEVIFREIEVCATEKKQYGQILKTLEVIADPAVLLADDKSSFRADSFKSSIKELNDIWLYECLPLLNNKLYKSGKKDWTKEQLMTQFIAPLKELKELETKGIDRALEEKHKKALIMAFIISDDFDDPFKLPTTTTNSS